MRRKDLKRELIRALADIANRKRNRRRLATYARRLTQKRDLN
jgi:hypothetical protein